MKGQGHPYPIQVTEFLRLGRLGPHGDDPLWSVVPENEKQTYHKPLQDGSLIWDEVALRYGTASASLYPRRPHLCHSRLKAIAVQCPSNSI